MASLSYSFHKWGNPLVSALLEIKLRFLRAGCETRRSVSRISTPHQYPTLTTTRHSPSHENEVWETMVWKVKTQQQQLMFIAYNHSSPVPSTSHTGSLNPPKGPSFISQIFTKGLPCARPRELWEIQPLL